MALRKSTWFWTGQTPRIGPIDAKAALIMPVFFLYMRPITIWLLLGVILTFTVVDLVIGHRFSTVVRLIGRRIAALGRNRLVIEPPKR